MAAERGGVGLNLILNSLILGNVTSPALASAYFVVASMAQLVISPWVPAADVTWLGHRNASSQIFRALAFATGLATFGFLALIFLAFPVTSETHLVVWPCITSNAAMIAVTLLVPLKYGNTRRYVAIAGLASISAVAIKLLAALSGQVTLVACSLFSDMMLLGLLALALGERSRLRGRHDEAKCEPILVWLQRMALAAVAVLVSLVPARLLIVASTLVLTDREHTSVGISMQLLNMVSLAGTALAGAVGGTMTAGGGQVARSVGLRTLPLIVGASVLYLVAAWLIAPSLLEVLYPDYSEALSAQLLLGAGFVPAALLSSVAWSLSGTLRRLPIFVVATAIYGVLAVVVFAQVGGSVAVRMFGWGATCMIGSLATLLLVLR